MTKEEAIKKLLNTKVYVDSKSKEIQKKLFELGFMWASKSKEVAYTNQPFIFISEKMFLINGSDMLFFKDNEYKEITADDILSITIDKECLFKPFDKVLVRNKDCNIWEATFVSYIIKNNASDWLINTVNGFWDQIIPFEGNEHLVGTSNSPDE